MLTSGLRVHRLLPDLLFRNFGLRLIRFGGGLVRLTNGLFQRRVSPFLVRKAQARLLSQTSSPSSERPLCSAAPHMLDSELRETQTTNYFSVL